MGIIQRQGTYNALITYGGIAIGFLNVLVLQPNMLKPEELGLTRVLFAAATLFGTLFPLGLNGVTLRYFPRFKTTDGTHHGFAFWLLSSGTMLFLLFAIALGLARPYIEQAYAQRSPLFSEFFRYVFPLTWLSGMVSLLTVYLFSLFQTVQASLVNDVVSRLYTTVLVSIYYLKIMSLNGLVLGICLGIALQGFMLFWFAYRTTPAAFRPNWSSAKHYPVSEIARYAGIMAFATLASIALRNVDVLILGRYSNLTEVAIYGIAVTIAGIIEAPANALGRIADTKISHAFSRQDFLEVKTIYYESTRVLMMLGFFLFCGVVLNAHSLLMLLPPAYHRGEIVVWLVAVSALFNMVTGINSSIIFYSDKYRFGTRLLGFLLVLSIALNLLLIPTYGMMGAAVATCTSLLLFNLVKYLYILYHFKFQPFGQYAIPGLGAFVLCLLLGILLPHHSSPLLDVALRGLGIAAIFSLVSWKWNLLPELKTLFKRTS